jgi:nucleoside-diphosphate-sugar epimerase
VDKLIFGDEGLLDCRDCVELTRLDIRAVGPEHVHGTDTIIHLAGLSNDPTAQFNPDANKSINLDATLRLAQIGKQCGVRQFVFASSCSVYYSERVDPEIRDEAHPVEPIAPYSWSKREAEIGLLDLADASFCPTVLRMGTVFGHSPRMRYDLVVNTFTRDAFTKQRLSIHAGGRMWRPLLHIDDAVRAYKAVLAADEDSMRGQIFNVLTCNCQVLTIAHEVRRVLEKERGIRLELDIQQVGIPRSYRVAGGKFRETIGVKQTGSISDAVLEMWDLMGTGIDLENPIYDNIRWFELLCDMERRLGLMGGSAF